MWSKIIKNNGSELSVVVVQYSAVQYSIVQYSIV